MSTVSSCAQGNDNVAMSNKSMSYDRFSLIAKSLKYSLDIKILCCRTNENLCFVFVLFYLDLALNKANTAKRRASYEF